MKSIFIIGSCVTRDAFNNTNAQYLSGYYARTSFASAFASGNLGSDECEFFCKDITSAFQKKCVIADLEKQLLSIISNELSSLFVIDLIDERFDLGVIDSDNLDGEVVCTLSGEIRETLSNLQLIKEVIPSRSIEFYKRWEAGWSRFIAWMNTCGKKNDILVNKTYWSKTINDKHRSQLSHQNWIEVNNLFLDLLYMRMSVDLPEHQFISPPEELLVANQNHKWGLQPYHFIDEYYKYVWLELQLRAKSSNFLTISSERLFHIQNPPILSRFDESYIVLYTSSNTKKEYNIAVESFCHGDNNVGDKDILFSLNVENIFDVKGLNLSDHIEYGYYKYVKTTSGFFKFTFKFSVVTNSNFIKFAFKEFYAKGDLSVLHLKIHVNSF